MKKLCILALCLLLNICLLTAASAVSLEEWNSTADARVVRAADVWTLPTDKANGVAPLISLPKGTLVKRNAASGDWCYIDYYAGGGIRSGVVAWDTVAPINGADPTASPSPTPTIEPIHTPEPTPVPTPKPTMPAGLILVEPETPQPEAAPTPMDDGSTLNITVKLDIGEAQAKAVMLGSCTSVVLVDGEQLEIPTADLDCTLALISAPKTGKATMRITAAGNAKSLGNVLSGTVVAVLEEGETWSRVWNNNTCFYVLTSCLDHNVAVDSPLGDGTICTSKGSTTGSKRMPLRVAAMKKSTKVAEWKVGTRVLVLRRVDDYLEIERNGLRGWMAAVNVKMDE